MGQLPTEGKKVGISDRLLDFAAEVIKLTYGFPKNAAGKHIGLQLIRSATSIGANYEESRGAQSRPDFIHKLQMAFKEAKETLYWVRLADKLELAAKGKLAVCLQEGNEIQLILGKSIVTSKGIQT